MEDGGLAGGIGLGPGGGKMAGLDHVIDDLGDLVARAGKPLDEHVHVNVTTHDPDLNFALVIDPDGVALSASGLDHVGDGPTLDLSAEAFLRLVAGRLDADHTPASTTATGIDIDSLRRVFPGF